MITNIYVDKIAQSIIEERVKEAALYNQFNKTKANSKEEANFLRHLIQSLNRMKLSAPKVSDC